MLKNNFVTKILSEFDDNFFVLSIYIFESEKGYGREKSLQIKIKTNYDI